VIDLAVLLAFVPAVAAVVVSPGPDTAYAVSRSLAAGRRAGAAAGAGTAVGVLVHTAGAALGLSALLRTSAVAYAALKYVGAAYLVYLGVRLLRREDAFSVETALEEGGTDSGAAGDGPAAGSDPPIDSAADSGRAAAWRSFRGAVAVNVANPQVAVFVLAFFPQFVSTAGSVPVQTAVLGVAYAGVSFAYLAGVAVAADRARRRLLGSERVQSLLRYTAASVFLALGAALLLEEPPA